MGDGFAKLRIQSFLLGAAIHLRCNPLLRQSIAASSDGTLATQQHPCRPLVHRAPNALDEVAVAELQVIPATP